MNSHDLDYLIPLDSIYNPLGGAFQYNVLGKVAGDDCGHV